MTALEFKLRTLTPLWTGGPDQVPDGVRETGLIGSLRWWYEALVRGLGGYACDPTHETKKCKEYNPRQGRRSICAACYLFGTTGWARLFRLRVIDRFMGRVWLNFVSTHPANTRWLKAIFAGERRNNRIDEITVPYGELRVEVTGRGQDDDYAFTQLAWTVHFAAKYGGLGAKLQHGFGLVSLETDVSAFVEKGEQMLKDRIKEFRQADNLDEWPNRERFFWASYFAPADHPLIEAFLNRPNCIEKTAALPPFIPCVFDLRYRGGRLGDRQLGFRQWLIDRRWPRARVSSLLGETRALRDEDRSASRLYIGMPWLSEGGKYLIKLYGFAPPLIPGEQIVSEFGRYMEHLLRS